MIHVYYAEDDEDIAGTVREFLGRRGIRVTVFKGAEAVMESLGGSCPSLVLVDWNLPDDNGAALCRRIRAIRKELPVIFLTVRNDPCDMVCGFQSGADDYVVKPFELEVLYLRIQALLRRAGNASGRYLSCGGICLDRESRTVHSGSEKISLSPSEYQLLLCLLQNKGRTVTRESLLENVWDSNGSFVNDNTLTVTMKRLREKLNQPLCLKTVRSIGYCMEDNGI